MSRVFILKSVLFWLLTTSCLFGEVAKGDLGIGLNFPGVGVRYFFSDKIAIELKGQIEKDIVVGGLRSYYYFNPEAKYLLFTGVEADFVSFEGEESKGTGIAGELFVGGEYFFARKLSLQMDFGPAYVSLSDDDTSESVDGLEYVANFGINYYFGK